MTLPDERLLGCAELSIKFWKLNEAALAANFHRVVYMQTPW